MKSRLRLLFLGSPAEAIHLGSLVAAHGYIFPISDHVLTLKDDGTLYRFQVGEFLYETMVRYQEDFSIVKLIPTIPAKLISIKVNAVYPTWGEGPPHRRRVPTAGTQIGPSCSGQPAAP